MGEIYRNAQRVVIWLGEQSEDSSLAVSTLRKIGEGVEYRAVGPNFSIQVKPGSALELMECNKQTISSARPSWIAINNLLRRPWFTRLWVLQEIGLASDTITVVGSEEISRAIFQGALIWIQHAQSFLSEFFDAQTRNRLAPFIFPIHSQTLHGLSVYARYTNCLDPHDRIYAVLSLLHPKIASLMKPDYSRTIEATYVNTVLAEIEGVEKLTSLELCRFPDQIAPNPLPSWMPDFSYPASFLPMNFCSLATSTSRTETTYDKREGTLRIPGRIIDSVSYISSPMPKEIIVEDSLEIWRKWEPVDAHTTEYVPGGGRVLEAFVAAISANYCLDNLFQTGFYPPIEALMDEYSRSVTAGRDIKQGPSQFEGMVHDFLKGRALFRTKKGYLGICSAAARVGDQVCIALAQRCPLMIHSVSGVKDRYRVGGVCFVPGLQFRDGLLGPLQSSWSSNFVLKESYPVIELYGPDNERTQLDPRAGPLPVGWEVLDVVPVGDDDAKDKRMVFRNVNTGEETLCDPRLTSENLKTLGIELEDIILV